jgi:hypothetical protein
MNTLITPLKFGSKISNPTAAQVAEFKARGKTKVVVMMK